MWWLLGASFTTSGVVLCALDLDPPHAGPGPRGWSDPETAEPEELQSVVEGRRRPRAQKETARGRRGERAKGAEPGYLYLVCEVCVFFCGCGWGEGSH